MRAYPYLVLALPSIAAAAQRGPEVAAMQTAREQLRTQGQGLHDQIRAEHNRLAKLQRRIDEMRHSNAALDEQIRHVVERQSRESRPAANPTPTGVRAPD